MSKGCFRMTIKLLDDHLINKIAAGEVIERPASVVKELVENAMDAGSSKIAVAIAGGGIDKIEVTDDGQGIAPEDIALALQRHATSKIISEADLQQINTMGFRGEALPSIASVSRLELYSQSGSQSGCRIYVEGGAGLDIQDFAAPPGTSIVIQDLFFNTPARKKFLKTSVSEGIRVHDLMCQLALSRPDISFSFANERKLYFKTPGNHNLRDTMAAIYGNDYASNFIEINWNGAEHALHGLVSKPDFRRASRKNQIFLVNNRLIKSPLLARAVDEGYRGLLLAREYPAVLLFLTIETDQVDVNVHPQKTEVRFRDEKAIFSLVSHTLKDRLSQVIHSGSIALNEDAGWSRAAHTDPSQYHRQVYDKASRFWQPGMSLDVTGDNLYERNPPIPAGDSRERENFSLPETDFAVIGQYYSTYILVETEQALWLVDQHAAHERIMYSRLLERRQKEPHSQGLSFPLAFDLSAAALDLWENNEAVFRSLGFDMEALGPDSVTIRAAPPELQGKEIEYINECLELLQNEQPLDMQNEFYALMACKQAIKAGDSLSRAEMTVLIKDLLEVSDFKHCPHGRPTIIEITPGELEKRFKRK